MTAALLLAGLLGCSPPDEPLPTPVLPGASSSQRGFGTPTVPGVDVAPPSDPGVLSPSELYDLAVKAGVGEATVNAVPRRLYSMSAGSPELAAVRTGVVLADAILSASATNAHDILERMRLVEAGLVAMGADEERRGQAGAIRAELERDREVPGSLAVALNRLVERPPPTGAAETLILLTRLLQVGAWLATLDTLAAGMDGAGKPELAATLLSRPAEASYFLAWTRRATQGRPADDPLRGLEGHLAGLSQLPAAGLAPADVRAHTASVLGEL